MEPTLSSEYGILVYRVEKSNDLMILRGESDLDVRHSITDLWNFLEFTLSHYRAC